MYEIFIYMSYIILLLNFALAIIILFSFHEILYNNSTRNILMNDSNNNKLYVETRLLKV